MRSRGPTLANVSQPQNSVHARFAALALISIGAGRLTNLGGPPSAMGSELGGTFGIFSSLARVSRPRELFVSLHTEDVAIPGSQTSTRKTRRERTVGMTLLMSPKAN